MDSLNKTAVLSILLAILGATALIPSAYAAMEVNGNGTGPATCLRMPSIGPASISFSAVTGSKTISGTGTVMCKIQVPTAPPGIIETCTASITSTGGTVTSKAYSLTGPESLNCQFEVGITTTASISGACGAAVTITWQDAQGDSGAFTGNVACST